MNWYHLSKISQSVVGINNLGNLVSGDVIGKTKNVLDHTILKIKTPEKKVKYLKPWEIKKTTPKKKKKKSYKPTFVDYLFSGVRYKKGKVLPSSMFLDKPDNETIFILHSDPQTGTKTIARIRSDQVMSVNKR